MDLRTLNYYWPRLGGLLAIIITIIVLIQWNSSIYLLRIIYLLHLAILMYHEFEEYVFPGGFLEFINTQTVFALPNPQNDIPVTHAIMFYINMSLWGLFALAAFIAEHQPWLGMGMIIMNFTNIIGHLGIFQIKKKGYNPGLMTAAFLMIPYSVYVFDYVISNDIMESIDWILAIISGLIAALSLPVTGIRMRIKFLKETEGIEMQR